MKRLALLLRLLYVQVKYNFQFVCASESSQCEEVSKFQWDKTGLQKHFELEPLHGVGTRRLLDNASETNCNLRVNILELRAQYHEECAKLWHERSGLHTRLAPYDSRIEASCESLHVPAQR